MFLVLHGRRLGPPVVTKAERRKREAAEYVEAMAALSRRARLGKDVARYQQQRLKRGLARRRPLDPNLPDREFLDRLAYAEPALSAEQLRRCAMCWNHCSATPTNSNSLPWPPRWMKLDSIAVNSAVIRRDTFVTLAQLYEQVKVEAAKVIVGQEEVFEQVLVAFLSGGHVLLEGVPGVAKTLIAKTLARLIDAGFGRIQFTADLMPSDVIGTQVFEINKGTFYLKKGPIFTNIVLADEINRAPAKTQSALLEAMEERQVTIEGARYPLDPPFMVLATQNPVEYEGTYPLPEAQLDRFLFKVVVPYPSEAAEVEIVRRYHQGFDAHNLESSGLQAVVKPADLPALHAEIQAVTVEDGILTYITQIAAGHAAQPRPDPGRQPACRHRHAAYGQDLCRAAGAHLCHPRRRQACAAAYLSPPYHPASRGGDRRPGCRRRPAPHSCRRARSKVR